MLKKLVVPFLMISAVVAFTNTVGCGSDAATTGTAGTGGAGKGTAGTSAAGTSAAGTSAAGTTAGTSAAGSSAAGTSAAGTTGTAGTGSDGGAGTSAAGTTGTDGSADQASTEAGADMSGGADAALPACSTTASGGTAVLSAIDFCKNMIATCTGITDVPAGYLNEATCETMYAARNAAQQHCQSYHLCGNSFGKQMSDKNTHCPHAAGAGPCVTGL